MSGTYSTIQQRRVDLFAELQEYGYTSEVDYANGVTLTTLDELIYSGGIMIINSLFSPIRSSIFDKVFETYDVQPTLRLDFTKPLYIALQ